MTRRRSPRPGTAHPGQEAEADIYAPPPPEEIERMVAELESGALDEGRRRARLAYNKKFPHRQMDVEYGLKPPAD